MGKSLTHKISKQGVANKESLTGKKEVAKIADKEKLMALSKAKKTGSSITKSRKEIDQKKQDLDELK